MVTWTEMDVPIIITVGSKPSERQIIYWKPDEIVSGKKVQESDKNSNEASENVSRNERKIVIPVQKSGSKAVASDRDWKTKPIEILLSVHGKNASERGDPKRARTSGGSSDDRSRGKTDVKDGSKNCLLCERHVSNPKEQEKFQPQNSKPPSSNSRQPVTDLQGDVPSEKDKRPPRDCLLCGRDISKAKEGKTDEEPKPKNALQPLAKKTVDRKHSLSWENSDPQLFHETGPTLDKYVLHDASSQPLKKGIVDRKYSLSWENSDRAIAHEEGPTDVPQPLTKEDLSSPLESSGKTLFFEPLTTVPVDEEESFFSLENSDTVRDHEKGLTITPVPKKTHTTEPVREKVGDSSPSKQTDHKSALSILNHSPSISETEAAMRDKVSTSSDETYFDFVKEEEIVILEEELPKTKGGVRAKLKAYIRRVRSRKTKKSDAPPKTRKTKKSDSPPETK